MSTVTTDPRIIGELRADFADDYLLFRVDAPVPPDAAGDAARLADEMFLVLADLLLAVDLSVLGAGLGPLQGITYSATVVPLPASVWLLAGALAWLVRRAR